MSAGRKTKPTRLKALTGNPGKRELGVIGETEPDPGDYVELPDPPDWLASMKYGSREWYSRGPVLVQMGLLTPADEMAFAAYCAQCEVMIRALEDIELNGQTIMGARGEVRNPALASLASATTAMVKLSAEFGLTPSSRGRMQLPGDDGESLSDLLGNSDDEPE